MMTKEERIEEYEKLGLSDCEKNSMKFSSYIKKEQKCWTCKHATNKYKKCSWSKELKPVEGWTAEEVPPKAGVTNADGWYRVINCPLYEVG